MFAVLLGIGAVAGLGAQTKTGDRAIARDLKAQGQLIFQDDFHHGLSNWTLEAERPGHVSAQGGLLEIDVPKGATLWLRRRLQGPIRIEYDAKVVQAGGTNDRVSDLNCFWMATDPTAPDGDPVGRRDGVFRSYNTLKTYYVGQGGNSNTTTRFRRYIGDPKERPLLSRYNLRDQEDLLFPNQWQHITLIADGQHIAYARDGKLVFHFEDDAPYRSGWFAIRTTQNHLKIRNLRIERLKSRE